VAEPCLEIQRRPEDAYTYTARGNFVAVVTNGTAVLRLGHIGALAAKPVMEGKGILFKAFADIDVFDLEGGSVDPDDLIRFCQLPREHLALCDEHGPIHDGREDLNPYQRLSSWGWRSRYTSCNAGPK
jgi:malic enzyme